MRRIEGMTKTVVERGGKAFTLVELPVVSRRKSRAFTLVELLVVVAIIGLLMTILMPSLTRARMMTLRVLCAGNLRGNYTAMTLYLSDNNDVYPCAEDPVSIKPFYWLWMGRGWREPLSRYLGGGVDQNNPSVLYCKGDPALTDKYEATSYAYSMSFYHSPEQIDQMSSTADTYSNAKPSVPQAVQDVTTPAKKILIGEWTSNHPRVPDDGGWWCWLGSRNYLFADGRVEDLPAEDVRPARDELPDPNLTIGGITGRDVD
ncbi:hypothetical protein LCGC14_2045430 [marine sediment metagenome]|uniref:Type II secretion system protein GspG C-terminal domain-containing protein n=1 Tax=marine sediment metagenome TaxID=412755 RepID=A0A0F9EQS0_9ZZZZ